MKKRRLAARVLWPLALLWTIPGMAIAQGLPLATTAADFYQPGTQRQDLPNAPIESMLCALCHGNYSEREEPYTRWANSMHGQAGRDPLMWAALAGAYGAAVVYRRLPAFQWPPGRVVVVAYGVVGVALLVYFYPLWSGTPIARDLYSARMWFQNGPARWI